MSEKITNIAMALHDIQAELKPIEKKGRNSQQNYAYAKFEDYIDGIKEILIKQGLTIVTTVNEPKRLEPRISKHGTVQYAVEVAITARLFHKTGEWIEIDCYGEGQDPGDKAIYKAITGARKYALACLLGLATKDDPENDDEESRQQKAGSTYQKQQQKYNENRGGATPIQKAAAPNQLVKPNPIDEGEVDAMLSVAVDKVNQAKDILGLRKALNEHWLGLKGLTGEGHPKLNKLKEHYDAKKLALEQLEQKASE